MQLINPLLNFLDWQRKTLEIILVKGEVACNKQFLILSHCFHIYLFIHILTLYQTINVRLFQTERICRRQFQIWWKWQKVIQKGRKTLWEKEKLLVTSNFSFSHNVFKRLVSKGRFQKACFQGVIVWECVNSLPHNKLYTGSNWKISRRQNICNWKN